MIKLPTGDPQPPQLVVSIPADDASNVAVNVMIALRFSKPLQMASINSTTLVLTGRNGAVSARVIPAEGGMLAFVQPLTTLEIGSNYALNISETLDNSGKQLADTKITFSTTESTAAGAIGLSGGTSTSDTAAGSITGNTADSSVGPPTHKAFALTSHQRPYRSSGCARTSNPQQIAQKQTSFARWPREVPGRSQLLRLWRLLLA